MTHLQLRTLDVIFKDVPHSMIPTPFSRKGLGHWLPTILHFNNVNFQKRTSPHDTHAVHTKRISKIIPQ